MKHAILVLVGLWAGVALGAEWGARAEVGDRTAAVGWLQLGTELGRVTLSGRIEGDLLCGCPRRLQLGASTTWGRLSGGLEAAVLATGRVDATVTGSWKTVGRTAAGLLSAQAGAKGALVDLLGARFPTGAGWASARIEREPLWAEAAANASLPGGTLQGEVRMGFSGPVWTTVSLSGSGLSLEWGASARGLFLQSYLSFSPPVQSVTLGASREGVRVQGRLTARGDGAPSLTLTLGASPTPWQGSVVISLSGKGIERFTAEVRRSLP